MKLSKRLRKWRANLTTQTPLDYVLMLHEDIIGFADEVKALEAENDRLRELVNDMWICISRGTGWDCTACPLYGTRECDFEGRMITLGIEVE